MPLPVGIPPTAAIISLLSTPSISGISSMSIVILSLGSSVSVGVVTEITGSLSVLIRTYEIIT